MAVMTRLRRRAFGLLSRLHRHLGSAQRMIASIRMIAKMPTIAAMAYKYSIGQPFIYPKNDLDYATNFLRMCFAVPCEEYKPNAVLARAMDRIFILHADHEQNASTSTVRLAGSSGANPFACIAAGCACLWGPAHGGANEAALNMLREIGTRERIPEYIRRAKDKNDSFRLMGFGHRVYKNYDPRAKIMQKTCHEVLSEIGIKDDPLLDVALELERIALHDEYFIEKKLYPNIDFYSGITLKAMGFPTTMFTVLFAVARTVGWISQWKEMIEDPQQKIGRPRQLYTGATAARLRADLAAEVISARRRGAGPFHKQARSPHERQRNPGHRSCRVTQPGGLRRLHQEGIACRASAMTISAARSAGALEPTSMIASRRENASIWRCRAGVSPNNGRRAAARFSAVQFC